MKRYDQSPGKSLQQNSVSSLPSSTVAAELVRQASQAFRERRMNLRTLMRQLARIGMLQFLLVAAANADWSPEQSQLISLSDAWIAAEVGHDKAALERILDERFLATFASSGKTIDRSSYIEWILQTDLDPFTVVNEVVNIHGDTALVISTEGTTKFTWVAVKKQGRWVVISETFSKITGTH